jgi:hypothetical protein
LHSYFAGFGWIGFVLQTDTSVQRVQSCN